MPQESRTLKSTVPEGAELQAECLLVREVKCVCVCWGSEDVVNFTLIWLRNR